MFVVSYYSLMEAAPLLAPRAVRERKHWFAVDGADHQYTSFILGIPYLAGPVGVFALLYASRKATYGSGPCAVREGGGGTNVVALIASLAFWLVLHRAYAVFPFFLSTAAFEVLGWTARYASNSYVHSAATATYALGVLLLVQSQGEHWGLFLLPGSAALERIGQMSRWSAFWPMMTLRIVSWAQDYAAAVRGDSVIRCSCATCLAAAATPATSPFAAAPGCERARVRAHRPLADYQSLSLFLQYMAYAPIYWAGPIVTFNTFAACKAQPQYHTSVATYWLRVVGLGLVMEAYLAFFHVYSLQEVERALASRFILHPYQGIALVFVVLQLLWTKLAVIWRFFRGWALLDGVEAPENMTRCIDGAESVAQFWRSWHGSFNQWLVRYLYIPLNGRKRPWLVTPLIFAFVAIWHELNLKLYHWALGTIFLILAESVVGGGITRSAAFGRFRKERPMVALALRCIGFGLLAASFQLTQFMGFYSPFLARHVVGLLAANPGWTLFWLIIMSFQALLRNAASATVYGNADALPELVDARTSKRHE
jgi:D-alanyl-lipoteichoic acid acyltransferase DltB (MBOAT superfamily)